MPIIIVLKNMILFDLFHAYIDMLSPKPMLASGFCGGPFYKDPANRLLTHVAQALPHVNALSRHKQNVKIVTIIFAPRILKSQISVRL